MPTKTISICKALSMLLCLCFSLSHLQGAQTLQTTMSKDELFAWRGLPEPLVPTGDDVMSEEIADLVTALNHFSNRKQGDDFTALEEYVASHPQSPWKMAVLTNLGVLYYKAGYFSKTMPTFLNAWEAGKNATEINARRLADRAAGEYAKMLARLGRYEDLKAFLASLGGRDFTGSSSELVVAGIEGKNSMENRPEIAFRCGPMALSRILASQNSPNWSAPAISNARSSRQGMSLEKVADISSQVGLNFQVAKRARGADLLFPSVIHWRVGHYAALIKKTGDHYLTEDPTFEGQTWHSLNALEEEASGYFLVPSGELPPGWSRVNSEEARTIFGKGATSGPTPNPKPGEPLTPPDGPGCQTSGAPTRMAVYSFRLMLASLQITDTPVGYDPPYGDPVQFQLTYVQRDPNQPGNFNFSNVGQKWGFNWQRYIIDDPANPASVSQAGAQGAYITFSYIGLQAGYHVYNTQFDTHQQLRRANASLVYELTNPDGSKEIYSQSDGSVSGSRKVFLTQLIDQAGNATTFNYDAQLRLTTVVDALGQVTRLAYDSANPFKITKVTDPFGRFCTLSYDSAGRLSQIQDVIGIQSIFTYEGNGSFVNSLTTPYGKTTFTSTETGVSRRLTATDPAGDTEVMEANWSQLNALPFSETLAPAGMRAADNFNEYLYFRNTFHWNKKQWNEAPNDYSKARLYHWLHDQNFAQISPYLESEKEPLQSRVWYGYPGQTTQVAVGSQTLPMVTGRVVEGGSRLTFRTYNSVGRVTSEIDPLNRQTLYEYSADGVDLLSVKQQKKLPQAAINAGGKVNGDFDSDYGYTGTLNVATTTNAIATAGVANAASQTVYQTVRYGADFTYTLKNFTPGSTYQIRLHFAESYLTQPGIRVFDVDCNGTRFIHNLDVFVAGGNRNNVAVVREFSAKPDAAGVFALHFTSTANFALIAGIEISELSPPPAPTLASFTYNAQHRPLTKTDGSGATTTYQWNSHGQLTAVTNARNETVSLTYYSENISGKMRKGRLFQIDGALAGTADTLTFDYDEYGRTASTVQPDGYTLNFAYDALDRLTRITFPDGTFNQYEFNALTLSSSKDRLGRLTTYVYNSLRQLDSVTDPANRTTRYRWCKCGDLKQLVDAMGRVTTWRHDVAGRATAKEYADGSKITYDYEPLSGQLSSTTDEKKQIKKRTYNLDGSLAGISYFNEEHETPDVLFTYDPVFRRMLQMKDGIGTTSYAYHPLAQGVLGAGQLASVDGPLSDDTLTYNYDELGRNTGYAINGVGEIRTFDALGRLATATNPLGLFTYSYVGATSRMDNVTYPGNVMTCQYNYHPATGDFRLKDIVHTLSGNTLLSRHSYEHNAVGNITRWTQISPQAGLNRSWLCGYDAADQLTSVTSQDPDTLANLPTGQYAYTYDSAGNRLTEIVDGVTSTASFNVLNQLTFLTTAGASTLQQQTYEWDAENRLVSVKSLATNHQSKISYFGTGLPGQIAEFEADLCRSNTSYLWNGVSLAEERQKMIPSRLKRYMDRGVQVEDSNATRTNVIISRDHLGSIRETFVDSQLASVFAYSPWGQRSLLIGTPALINSAISGHISLEASGLVVAPFRVYHPGTARWINRDPIQERGGINLYAYVNGNPVLYADGLGLLGENMQRVPRPPVQMRTTIYGPMLDLLAEQIKIHDDRIDLLQGPPDFADLAQGLQDVIDQFEKYEPQPCSDPQGCLYGPKKPRRAFSYCDYFPDAYQCRPACSRADPLGK